MQKFSSSYGGTKENFIVKNFSARNYKVEENIYSVLCVVQNIFRRGKPTKPSKFLISKLGNLDTPPVYLIDDSKIIWNNIKGDDENLYYPARKFFYETLPQWLGAEYSFVRNLILPEVDFADLLTKTKKFNGQAVDFYLPQMKIVFEIDGSSHNEFSQQQKDNLRDLALKNENIEVIRIKTYDLENETRIFRDTMKNFIIKLRQSPLIQEYKAALQISAASLNVQYTAVIRLQIALMECFKNGVINIKNPELNIKIVNSDVPNIARLLNWAYEDLTQWILNIAQLAKVKIKIPNLTINAESKNTIALDFSIFRRYADGDENFNAQKTTIYIRTDYFPDKNYYRVADAQRIKYKFTAREESNDAASLKFLLKNIFGHDEFRQGQLPILKNILNGNDTIGILPTGTGKSLCYQLAALLQPGVSLIIVPIIALMEDQRRVMEEKGINRVAYINSNDSGDVKKSKLYKFQRGKFQFMVISPERLQDAEFRKSIGEINRVLEFSLAVIDEVHCLSEWGHDFRPAYLRLIPTIREYCPQAKLLGLTATASQAVLNDLKAEFENDGSGVKALPNMDREELIFHRIKVSSDNERNAKILEIIRQNEGTYTAGGIEKNSVGLIFCQTVKKLNGCINLQEKLLKNHAVKNGDIELYHGQMEPKGLKIITQKKFMEKNFAGLMVCTTAFGMGIDKENIKYTIHNTLPKSIEAFYQEAGRAGRDEIKFPKSHCYIIHKPETVDKSIIEKIFDISTSISERWKLSQRLHSDLETVMFFLNNKKFAPEVECNTILKLSDDLYNYSIKYPQIKLHFYDEDFLKTRQMQLHKLAILGIVKDWTVEYSNLEEGKLSVEYCGVDIDKVKNSLLHYIRKHDAEFSLDDNTTDYKPYRDLFENFSAEPLRAYLMILIEWTNNTILYSRLQSSKNMLDLCSENVTDEEFRQTLNEFFKYTEQTVILDDIIQEPRNYKNWFIILMVGGSAISKDKAQSVSNSLRRYLESYANNTGLNYLYGMLALICGTFEGSDGEWRLFDSFRNIKESFSEIAQEKIIEKTLKIVRSCAELEQNLFSETFLKIYPELVLHVHRVLRDLYSLSLILDTKTLQIKILLEENAGGLFKTP